MAAYRISVRPCDPKACGFRCQEICPTGVFLASPGKKLKNLSIEPEYRIDPRWPFFCNGCMECVERCPEKAITVKSSRLFLSRRSA